MGFRYYIFDRDDCMITGTNDEQIAGQFADRDQYAVLDTETSEQWYEVQRSAIKEIPQ